jgi:hypothetical protein
LPTVIGARDPAKPRVDTLVEIFRLAKSLFVASRWPAFAFAFRFAANIKIDKSLGAGLDVYLKIGAFT